MDRSSVPRIRPITGDLPDKMTFFLKKQKKIRWESYFCFSSDGFRQSGCILATIVEVVVGQLNIWTDNFFKSRVIFGISRTVQNGKKLERSELLKKRSNVWKPWLDVSFWAVGHFFTFVLYFTGSYSFVIWELKTISWATLVGVIASNFDFFLQFRLTLITQICIHPLIDFVLWKIYIFNLLS